MKYNIGDKVRIRTKESLDNDNDVIGRGLAYSHKHGGCNIVGRMTSFLGKEVTINSMRIRDIAGYKIKEDGGTFIWQDWMFEDILQEDVW